jgi:hypothetical protein
LECAALSALSELSYLPDGFCLARSKAAIKRRAPKILFGPLKAAIERRTPKNEHA